MAKQDCTPAAANTKRTIGVSGLIVTLVGFVIGISIYIIPGALAASAGPAVVLSHAIAGVVTVLLSARAIFGAYGARA